MPKFRHSDSHWAPCEIVSGTLSPLTTPKDAWPPEENGFGGIYGDCRVIVVFVGNDIIVWQSVGLENLSDPG